MFARRVEVEKRSEEEDGKNTQFGFHNQTTITRQLGGSAYRL
jgi:hypothetical protein